ncbi:MAG: ubiquinone biosynthesis protein [Deltaproteobacteria bacterium]|nr:ubiquinone biosynthesis protein [Deltaproteobacteria bacterium]
MKPNPIESVRAVAALVQNPNDTEQVFRLVGSLGGTSRHLVRTFARSTSGARLLADRPDIRARLDDREALARLPEGSLGRAYLVFMESDRLDSGFLVEADRRRNRGREHLSDEERWVGERLRDTHDLWHALTGYGGDVLGEAALLAFSFAQTRGGAFGVLASVAYLRVEDEDARRLLVDGFARGLGAAWLPALPWEALLAEPVEELRRRLRVGEVRSYIPVSAAELLAGRAAVKASS